MLQVWLPPRRPEAECEGQQDSAICSAGALTFKGTTIKLEHVVLLHAQILRLLYSPVPAETAEAMREVGSLSFQMLETSGSGSLEGDGTRECGDSNTEQEAAFAESSSKGEEVSFCLTQSATLGMLYSLTHEEPLGIHDAG